MAPPHRLSDYAVVNEGRRRHEMRQDGRFAFLCNPASDIITTWAWFSVGEASVMQILLAVYGFNLAAALAVSGEKPLNCPQRRSVSDKAKAQINRDEVWIN